MDENEIYEQGILLVDDEEHVRYLWSEVLREAGFKNTFMAKNGLECINVIQEHKDQIALVLMDIRFDNVPPNGWDGLDTVRHLMNIYQGIVGVIFVTAYDSFQEEASELGNDRVLNLDYLIKSYDTTQLIRSVVNNIKLILQKRREVKSNTYGHISHKIDSVFSELDVKMQNLISEIHSVREEIGKSEKSSNSIFFEIGKQVIVILILAAFVICALYFDLGTYLKKLLLK